MEKRIGTVSVLISNREIVPKVNQILSEFGNLILARQGLPLHERGLHFISLIMEATTDELSAMTGRLGRLPDVEVKSILAKSKFSNHNNQNLE
ncbi:MAG TPA: iron-only hydrogenase system regulator [Bacteroidales bacterium]|jgi:putative iron-only hydrogenase system regulator|nr:iron-only hydrogenase system regulator [Bacteroidales bacterium]HPT51665.1 iron-only hydrogenase system regulator [Bacteroidales bacterium]